METVKRIHPVLKGLKYVGFAIGGAILIGVIALIFGVVVMHLWNWLMPEIFGLTTINFWHAVGLVILARLLMGGFGHRRDSHDNHSRHHSNFFKSKFFGKAHDRKWKYYDKFWKEEGEGAFDEYVEKKRDENKAES